MTEQAQDAQQHVVEHTVDGAEAGPDDTAQIARAAVDEAAPTARDSAYDD